MSGLIHGESHGHVNEARPGRPDLFLQRPGPATGPRAAGFRGCTGVTALSGPLAARAYQPAANQPEWVPFVAAPIMPFECFLVLRHGLILSFLLTLIHIHDHAFIFPPIT